ncbi:hypothetical protein BGX28_003851 [Mortierella sp. GBA30]|nr:hypothetical protein BGX28_003851 [Mortierella sp. GBA30]
MADKNDAVTSSTITKAKAPAPAKAPVRKATAKAPARKATAKAPARKATAKAPARKAPVRTIAKASAKAPSMIPEIPPEVMDEIMARVLAKLPVPARKPSTKSTTTTSKAKTSTVADSISPPQIYQLKITLLEASPPIWRRILVPSNITLLHLHSIIIAAMGWSGGHSHEFQVGSKTYADAFLASMMADMGESMGDESKVYLNQVAAEPMSFGYLYDQGDNWEHEIKFEKTVPFTENMVLPSCVAGKRACPPDDCGGVWGYEDLVEKLQGPNNAEKRELQNWLGRKFDPEEFSLPLINLRLRTVRN